MNNDWYARQFGERDQFAVAISLGSDPHPTGDLTADAGWGSLSLWVRGRCLTRNVSSEGAVSDVVRWSLTSVLKWLTDVAVRIVNEETFPEAAHLDHVRDACHWFNATETPLLSLTESEEDDWFLRRSDWRQHHALRRAAVDAALPNVMIRRLGDFLEVSWDNETWATSRPDLSFVEQRGTELVPAARAASNLRAAIVDVTHDLSEHHKLPALGELASAASTTGAGEDDWQWLIHQHTARVIHKDLAPLRDRLRDHARTQRSGLYIPHAPETFVLRHARLVSPKEIGALLKVAGVLPKTPMKAPLLRLIRPTQASTTTPWKEGYERAQEVRDALNWGDAPLPDLTAWMKSNHLAVASHGLSSSIDLIATRTEDRRGSIVLNPQTQSHLHREIAQATALGHILLDTTPVALDGTWEHWPSAARARAFAAMLLLPDDGVRETLGGQKNLGAKDVKRVMSRFNTGPYATTFHLRNLGFIRSDERRVEILQELAAY